MSALGQGHRGPHGTRAGEVFAFIERYDAKNGFAPTVREVAAAMGVRSPSRAWTYINLLVEQGKLKRIPGKQRNIALIKTICCPNCQHSFEAARR